MAKGLLADHFLKRHYSAEFSTHPTFEELQSLKTLQQALREIYRIQHEFEEIFDIEA